MIVCVAGSPSIDKLFEIERLVPGAIHRPESFVQVAGGKGLNVARAASALGAQVVATGLLAGPAGRWIDQALRADGVTGQFVWTEGQTRSSLSVSDRQTAVLTEFYEADAAGSPDAWAQLEKTARRLFSGARWCVLSGSLPLGSPHDGYARLAAAAHAAGARTALDVRGEPLGEALRALPSLVKINRDEAEELLGGPVPGVDGARRAVLEIRRLAGGDGHAAAVTLGAAGAVLVDPDGASWFGHLEAHGRYPVGCGDSFLAGLVVALDRGDSWPEALALALGVAAANAELPGAARFDLERVGALAASARVASAQ